MDSEFMDFAAYERAVRVRESEIISEDIARATQWIRENGDATPAAQHAFTLEILIDRLSRVRDEALKPQPRAYDPVEASANWFAAKALMHALEGAMEAGVDRLMEASQEKSRKASEN